MSDKNYELEFCEACIQMTNYLDGVCQKCSVAAAASVSKHAITEKREDKIFNNSYYHGDNLKGDDYNFNTLLTACDRYSKSYLRDIYDPENSMQMKMIREEILKLLETNSRLQEILDDNNNKKFNKQKINEIFEILHTHFTTKSQHQRFVNLIYIFDNISNLTGLKYNNLFDLLEYDYKEMLILELDKHYNVLNASKSNSKMF